MLAYIIFKVFVDELMPQMAEKAERIDFHKRR